VRPTPSRAKPSGVSGNRPIAVGAYDAEYLAAMERQRDIVGGDEASKILDEIAGDEDGRAEGARYVRRRLRRDFGPPPTAAGQAINEGCEALTERADKTAGHR
jgi:hypothetical protein